MKILSIDIYGFGQFEDRVFHLNNSKKAHIFYGYNEAGKTTIISFIHAILFGFPTKQSNENRFEPKKGGKYGGKLLLQVHKDRTITIERIAGRAVGEVKVYDNKGLAGDEEVLRSLLNGLNRSLYLAIYSFSFKGLQEIEAVNAAELSRYLFSAGAYGSHSLFDFEKKINKQLDDLYKPNGQKPTLNEKITGLIKLRERLHNWTYKMDEYNSYVKARNSLLIETEKLNKKVIENAAFIKEYEKKRMLKPYVEERKRLQIQLGQLSNYQPFPIDGLNRLKELQFQVKPLKGQSESVTEKITEIEKRLADISFNQTYLDNEETLYALKEKQKLCEMQEKKVEEINATLKHELSEITSLMEKLGTTYTEERIQAADTSLIVKQQIKELATKQERLDEQQKFLDEQFRNAKLELEKTELAITHLKRGSGTNHKKLGMLLSAVITLLGIGAWLLTQSLYPLLFIIAFIIAFSFYSVMNNSKARQQLEREKIILQQKQQLFEGIMKQFEVLEDDRHLLKKDLALLCTKYSLPNNLSGNQLVTSFELLEDLKKRLRSKNQLLTELVKVKSEIVQFYSQISKQMELFQLTGEASTQALIEMITTVEREKELKFQKNRLIEKHQDLLDESSRIQKQIEEYELSIKELFAGAMVDNEEDYRKKGKAAGEYEEIAGKLKATESHIKVILKDGEKNYINEVENENFNYEELMKQVGKETEMLHGLIRNNDLKIAEIGADLKALEEVAAYSELTHKYEIEKSAFQTVAGQWAILQVAKDLIEKTKNFYREVRLPHVIEKAQHFFSFLTFGRYIQIYAPTEDTGFTVERADGIRFKPGELSQATKEQLYLAIRLALAIHHNSPSPLPLIIDDSFVNFDRERAERAFELIRKISTDYNHQVLFFSCHEHAIKFFENENIIYLK